MPLRRTAETTQDAALTAFLDAEFEAWVKMQPQLATRLGRKDGGDKWNDPSEAAARSAAQMAAGQRRADEGEIRPCEAVARSAGQL
jgi:hypothetical protein